MALIWLWEEAFVIFNFYLISASPKRLFGGRFLNGDSPHSVPLEDESIQFWRAKLPLSLGGKKIADHFRLSGASFCETAATQDETGWGMGHVDETAFPHPPSSALLAREHRKAFSRDEKNLNFLNLSCLPHPEKTCCINILLSWVKKISRIYLKLFKLCNNF